ncbi:MAG: rRNA pseudouridine synthase [Flavonifractor sp.]|nr:rRNA pseudouridine synthase [Flavonifractor sp.]
MEERLQKLLSAHGITSRRGAEAYLTAGRVTVNGRTAQVGDKADPERDDIQVDGIPLASKGERTYLMLHKPRGYVTTLSDERGRRTAAELVAGCGARVWPVGRLDLDSEGLLLFTDDGALTQRLLHPSHEVEKEYRVWVSGDLEAALPLLRAPMTLDGVCLHPARIAVIDRERGVLSVVIHQGKKRQVRRMCAQAGLTVRRLKRVREGALELGALPPGRWRRLTEDEVRRLWD